MSLNNNDMVKKDAMTKINGINAIEGFDPTPLALEIGNMNEGGVRHRLPVMVQMAWFRLKYPEGRLAVSVKPGKDANGNVYFIADAKVYAHYNNPVDCYLAEGSASRGYLSDKPTVSPREWAQTAAIGMALRNAGFGLQFAVAGESYDDNTLNELSGMTVAETPDIINTPASAAATSVAASNLEPPLTQPPVRPATKSPAAPPPPSPAPEPELTPLEKAMSTPCPISKYQGKTMGEVLRENPGAVAYIVKNPEKYSTEAVQSAKLICETAMEQSA